MLVVLRPPGPVTVRDRVRVDSSDAATDTVVARGAHPPTRTAGSANETPPITGARSIGRDHVDDCLAAVAAHEQRRLDRALGRSGPVDGDDELGLLARLQRAASASGHGAVRIGDRPRQR